MAASPIQGLPAVVSIAPRLEPHLVEVMVWYPFGAADEAVAAAAAKVEELLARPDLGAVLVDAPSDLNDDSPRAADTAFVQAIARIVVEEAQNLANAAVSDLITKPGAMRSMLPTEPPATPGTPWLNKGVLAFTPDA